MSFWKTLSEKLGFMSGESDERDEDELEDGELTGSVLLVGQGGGGKSGDGSYTLPTATPFRLGGVKVGDGLTVDNEGKLSVDAANTEETTGALNEVFGAEDGK